jgi:hypothetical protein
MEKTNMLGWANGVGSCLNIVMTLIAGFLCTLNWKYTFFAYGFFVIVLLMEHFSLPSMPVPKVRDANGVEHKAKVSYTPKTVRETGYRFIIRIIIRDVPRGDYNEDCHLYRGSEIW